MHAVRVYTVRVGDVYMSLLLRNAVRNHKKNSARTRLPLDSPLMPTLQCLSKLRKSKRCSQYKESKPPTLFYKSPLGNINVL